MDCMRTRARAHSCRLIDIMIMIDRASARIEPLHEHVYVYRCSSRAPGPGISIDIVCQDIYASRIARSLKLNTKDISVEPRTLYIYDRLTSSLYN